MNVEKEMLDELSRPRRTRFWTIERLIKLVVFACGLVVAGFVLILDQQFALKGRFLEQEVDMQINRAVSCRVLVATGRELDPDGPCFSPDVLEHYDPAIEAAAGDSKFVEVKRNHERTQRLLCLLLEAHDETALEC